MSDFISQPHDHFVRRMLGNKEITESLFQQHLPDHIKKEIDLKSLQLHKETFIDKELQAQAVDLLYKVRCGQKMGYLYLLVEHQSTSDYWMPFRLLKYMVGIMDHHIRTTKSKELPIVYPLVLYANKQAYDHPTDILSLFGQQKKLAESILWKPFQLIDLTLYPEERLKIIQNLEYQLFLRSLKNVWLDDFIPYLKEMTIDLIWMEKEGKKDYIQTILKYFAVAGESKKREEFRELIQSGFSKETEENIMRISEQFRQEGIQQGRVEGLQQGKMEGIQQGRMEGRTEGILLGQQKTIQAMAIKLLRQGQEAVYISQLTDLPIDEVLALKRTLEKGQ